MGCSGMAWQAGQISSPAHQDSCRGSKERLHPGGPAERTEPCQHTASGISID